jgi:hypothetical protein
MAEHDLKIWPEFFDQLMSGQKTFELRNDDRGYAVGDVLRLREWILEGHFYSGREARRQVTHLLRHRPDAGCAATFGLAPGFVILSIAELPDQQSTKSSA